MEHWRCWCTAHQPGANLKMKTNPYLENSRQAICDAIAEVRGGRIDGPLLRNLAFALTELDAFRHGDLQTLPFTSEITEKALGAALSDCEREANSPDALAVIVGKMSLRRVVELARYAYDQQKTK